MLNAFESGLRDAFHFSRLHEAFVSESCRFRTFSCAPESLLNASNVRREGVDFIKRQIRFVGRSAGPVFGKTGSHEAIDVVLANFEIRARFRAEGRAALCERATFLVEFFKLPAHPREIVRADRSTEIRIRSERGPRDQKRDREKGEMKCAPSKRREESSHIDLSAPQGEFPR